MLQDFAECLQDVARLRVHSRSPLSALRASYLACYKVRIESNWVFVPLSGCTWWRREHSRAFGCLVASARSSSCGQFEQRHFRGFPERCQDLSALNRWQMVAVTLIWLLAPKPFQVSAPRAHSDSANSLATFRLDRRRLQKFCPRLFAAIFSTRRFQYPESRK
jgi:hypothetical protein